ncbi:hypothetical protein B9Z55_022935 [Caenorhabditis nigoni]|uniref:F-box domain-containing protein n=1 Tax=Caenorhabditis nigoni TaxID=1611254 RepID=A0A2G5SME0_9PELO|nr:hypothetical protein B9Z55_022935 [Caenorhabditis nigoni]
MPVAFTRFPDLVQKEILDLMETSKRSRSLSQRSAKLHKGNMKIQFFWEQLTSSSSYFLLTYYITNEPVPESPIVYLELKESNFEHLEKYLNVRHSSLFVNMTISMDFSCWTRFESSFLTLAHRTQLYSSKTWHVMNVFNRCHDIPLEDSYFEESEVVEILKRWKIGSSIQYLSLTFVRAGSNENFEAKMIEINAEHVPGATNGNLNIPNYDVSSWSLYQENSNVEGWITIANLTADIEHVHFNLRNRLFEPENL